MRAGFGADGCSTCVGVVLQRRQRRAQRSLPVALLALATVLLPDDGSASAEPAAWVGLRQFLTSLAVLAVFVPLQAAAEEYVFRGWLTQAVGAFLRSPWLAVLPQAALFATAHGWGTTWGFTDLLLFGLVTGWLTIRTGGLEAAIALHVLNNLLAFGVSAAVVDGLSSDDTAADASWQLRPHGHGNRPDLRRDRSAPCPPPPPAAPHTPVGHGSACINIHPLRIRVRSPAPAHQRRAGRGLTASRRAPLRIGNRSVRGVRQVRNGPDARDGVRPACGHGQDDRAGHHTRLRSGHRRSRVMADQPRPQPPGTAGRDRGPAVQADAMTVAVISSYTVPKRAPGVKAVSRYQVASGPAASRASPPHSMPHSSPPPGRAVNRNVHRPADIGTSHGHGKSRAASTEPARSGG
ncbi:hypothetical protein SGRIM128S_04708 [Streptomyces griseomycini]